MQVNCDINGLTTEDLTVCQHMIFFTQYKKKKKSGYWQPKTNSITVERNMKKHFPVTNTTKEKVTNAFGALSKVDRISLPSFDHEYVS